MKVEEIHSLIDISNKLKMSTTKNKELKETFKEAIIEVLETRRDLLVDAVTEAMEDISPLPLHKL